MASHRFHPVCCGLMADRIPQPVHENDRASPAPGELELVRSAMALHDHEAGNAVSLPPSPESMEWWLRSRGLLRSGERATKADLSWALDVLSDLRRTVDGVGPAADRHVLERLDRAARTTNLRPRFRTGNDDHLGTDLGGVRGAIGRLLGISFIAQLDGKWQRLRGCSDPTCLSVFYDRSRNRSGKWCSMSSCGNRNKVRSFRERSKAQSE
jgi:hypothetical protein